MKFQDIKNRVKLIRQIKSNQNYVCDKVLDYDQEFVSEKV